MAHSIVHKSMVGCDQYGRSSTIGLYALEDVEQGIQKKKNATTVQQSSSTKTPLNIRASWSILLNLNACHALNRIT